VGIFIEKGNIYYIGNTRFIYFLRADANKTVNFRDFKENY